MQAPNYECIYFDISINIINNFNDIKNYLNNILLFCENYFKVKPNINYLFIQKNNLKGASIFLIGPSKYILNIKTVVDPIYFGGYSWNEFRYDG